jgi:hypothetical protein
MGLWDYNKAMWERYLGLIKKNPNAKHKDL